jgi:hypothetical protein
MYHNKQHEQLKMKKEIEHSDIAQVYKLSEHPQISHFSHTVEYPFQLLN